MEQTTLATQTQLINQWIAADCDPNLIPAFLLADGLAIGEHTVRSLSSEVNRQAGLVANEFIATSTILQEFLDNLRKGKPVFVGLTSRNWYQYTNLAHLEFTPELQAKILSQFSIIKEDSRLLSAAVSLVEKSFQSLWDYNPGGRYETIPDKNCSIHSNYFGCSDERYAKFYLRLNPNIERLERLGDRSFLTTISSPFYNPENPEERRYTHCYELSELNKKLKEDELFKSFDRPRDFSFDEIIFLAYGLDRTEKLTRNFWQSIALIETSSQDGYNDRVLNKFCHGRLTEAQNIPSLKSFINRTLTKKNVSSFLNYDADVAHGLIVYLDGRSEYGGSGGVGQIRQVILLCGREQVVQEFTYRDRYSSESDNYALEFSDVKFIDIRAEGEYLFVQVKATPADSKRYPSRILSFRIKTDASLLPPELSDDNKVTFLAEWQKRKQEKMAEFLENASHRTGQAMSKDYSGYAPYPQPSFSTPEAVDESLGLGAFVIKECIDCVVTTLQWRYRLYLARFGQPLKEIHEDHAYENEGDAAICGLSFLGGKLSYTTRAGRREHDCLADKPSHN